MPKIKKDAEQSTQNLLRQELKQYQLRKLMFTSSLWTYLVAVAFFVVSFIFNGMIYQTPDDAHTALKIILIIVKAGSIIAYFFFMMISFANFMELREKVMSVYYLVIIFATATLQSITDIYVFIITLAGNIIVIIYLYIMQGKIAKRDRLFLK